MILLTYELHGNARNYTSNPYNNNIAVTSCYNNSVTPGKLSITP
jgi:hypothetical protein